MNHYEDLYSAHKANMRARSCLKRRVFRWA